jgi:hypothetical protein
MKVTVISLFLLFATFLLLSNFVIAEEFDFNFEKEMVVGIPKQIDIKIENEKIYEAKAFVKDSKGLIISEMYYTSWISPDYVKLDTTPLLVRVSSGEGERLICVRIKEPEKINYYELCKNITLLRGNNLLNGNNIYLTDKTKIREIVIFIIIGFCIVLLIVILLSKIKEYNYLKSKII